MLKVATRISMIRLQAGKRALGAHMSLGKLVVVEGPLKVRAAMSYAAAASSMRKKDPKERLPLARRIRELNLQPQSSTITIYTDGSMLIDDAFSMERTFGNPLLRPETYTLHPI